MQIAVRSSITAGVAVLGAGVIVASPLAPPVPELHFPAIHASAFNLSAAVAPMDVYSQVLHEAATNIQTLTAGADPAPALKQIVTNQISSLTALAGALQSAGGQSVTALTKQVPAALQTAVDRLGAGDITGAVNALLTVPLLLTQPAINLVPALERTLMQPVQNLVNVAKIFSDPLYDSLFAVGMVGPLITGLGATAVAVQNVIDAAVKGDLQQVGNAILTAPAVIADGVLNGGYGPDLGPLVGGGFSVLAGGLLTPGGFEFTPDFNIVLNVAGPVATLQQLGKLIAGALKPANALTTESVRTHPAAMPAAAATADTRSAVGQSTPAPTKRGPATTLVAMKSAGKTPTPATAARSQSHSHTTKKTGTTTSTRHDKRGTGSAGSKPSRRSSARR